MLCSDLTVFNQNDSNLADRKISFIVHRIKLVSLITSSPGKFSGLE